VETDADVNMGRVLEENTSPAKGFPKSVVEIVKGCDISRADDAGVVKHAVRFEVAEVAGQRGAEVERPLIHLFFVVALVEDPEEVCWDFETGEDWVSDSF